MSRIPDGPSHVSLFPIPPWELIDKYTDFDVAHGTAPQPPQIPFSTTYQIFGIRYNTDDPILRPLESFGFRRIYQQNSGRKAELKKLNFSILANYLDLLDILTRDPNSGKRKDKLDHIGELFINMHHLLNEYRPHQARDLLREMLTYQVKIASETVHLCEQYLARTNETLSAAAQAINPVSLPANCSFSPYSVSFEDLGPELDCLLSGIQNNMKIGNPLARANVIIEDAGDVLAEPSESMPLSEPPAELFTDQPELPSSIDSAVWNFFRKNI